MTLSRRDRLAAALALDCLRSDDGIHAAEALSASLRDGPFMWPYLIWDSWERALADGDAFAVKRYGSWRLLRARLALLLRATLRADAVDFSRRRCASCGSRYTIAEPDDDGLPSFWCGRERRWQSDGPGVWDRRITPLWQSEAINDRAAKARERMGR